MSDRIRSLWIVEISDDGETWRPLSVDGADDTPVYAWRSSEDASAMASPAGQWAPGVQRRVVQFVVPAGDRR